MRVLVVGGSGFIGTRLIATLLEQGHSVTNFDLVAGSVGDVPTHLGDVRDADALTVASEGHDAIVNLAAVHRDDVRPVSLYEEVNVGGARAVAEAAERAQVSRICFTSSVAVYGLGETGASEDSTPRPYNDYGRTKLAAEQIYREWAQSDPARSLVIVRPSVVFGEGNRGNVYTLARQVASGRFIMIGDGSNRKSMSYVGNVVDFLATTVDSPPGIRLVNYADKPDLSTAELIDVLRSTMDHRPSRLRLPLSLGLAAGHLFDAAARASRRTFPISAIRIRKFVADTTVNTDRLASSGYSPPVPLAEAIARTIRAEFPSADRSR